jgi:beta-glucosidase
MHKGAAWVLGVFCAGLAAVLWGQPTTEMAYRNPDLPAEKRAADIVARMTLEEKVLQMQNSAPAIDRLGIPAYNWWNEALHGVARGGEATVFPQAIGLAAMWDTDLMHRIADTIATEARAKHNEAIRTNTYKQYLGLTFWSPNINIFRDPRWGRGQETYGEDPFLTGQTGVAFIKGLQGDDPNYFKTIATAKHFAVHSGPEPLRHKFDVEPSERDLNETYLPAFRAAVVEGHVDSIMCAYNSVNGIPACANTDLLQKSLHGEWGFQGFVVSDCGAINDIYRQDAHKYKPNAAEASALAVKAGTDLTCGTEYRALVDAVKNGLITEAEINRSLERLFVARFKLGMFDPPERVPFSKIPYSENASPAHRKVALEAARESIVLLKNDGALPLKTSVRKIAVIGPAADDPVSLLGNYNGFSQVQVTPLAGIEQEFKKAEVHYSLGGPYVPQSQVLVPSNAFVPPTGAGRGLLAEYFDNTGFTGQPKLARVEPRVFQQADITDAELAAALPKHAAAVRWTGMLRPPVSGEYAIAGRGGFGTPALRIFLDDKELLPEPGSVPAAPGGRGPNAPIRGSVSPAHVQLDAEHAYRFRVEYKPANPAAAAAQLLWLPPEEPLLAEAVENVKNSDVTVAFVGLNPNLEGEEFSVYIAGFAGGDRTDLKLPDTQERLIEAAILVGKPVIVVLTSGSALAANYAAVHAAAVLELWYGGEEAGTAIAETLSGVNNPAGRLPVTFYRGVDQLPPFEDYSMKGRTYRYFQGDPLFSFGFGLSYSKFDYSALHAVRSPRGGQISVHVKNSSNREGDEVVQMYVSTDKPGDAIRQLRGFQRIHLKPGESGEVDFSIPAAELPKDKLKISVGGGQPIGKIPHLDAVL